MELEEYITLVTKEADTRPAEAMLVREIFRLRTMTGMKDSPYTTLDLAYELYCRVTSGGRPHLVLGPIDSTYLKALIDAMSNTLAWRGLIGEEQVEQDVADDGLCHYSWNGEKPSHDVDCKQRRGHLPPHQWGGYRWLDDPADVKTIASSGNVPVLDLALDHLSAAIGVLKISPMFNNAPINSKIDALETVRAFVRDSRDEVLGHLHEEQRCG